MVDNTFIYGLLCFLCLLRDTTPWEYCKTCISDSEYCEFGCCGNRCCDNKIAIGVGTAIGGIVLLLLASGSFVLCIQRRYYNVRRKTYMVNAFVQCNNEDIIAAKSGTQTNAPRKAQPPPPYVIQMTEHQASSKQKVDVIQKEATTMDIPADGDTGQVDESS